MFCGSVLCGKYCQCKKGSWPKLDNKYQKVILVIGCKQFLCTHFVLLLICSSWSCGYDGSQLQFISKDVMCYKSGIHVKFVKGSEEETVYSSPGEGLAAVAVHGVNKVFAIADQSVPPKIFVVNYPTFTQKSLLEGKLTYRAPFTNMS